MCGGRVGGVCGGRVGGVGEASPSAGCTFVVEPHASTEQTAERKIVTLSIGNCSTPVQESGPVAAFNQSTTNKNRNKKKQYHYLKEQQ